MAEKILIVDKNLAVQKLLEFALGREGFQVSVFSDSLSALDAALKNPPVLCVVEYGMEGLRLPQFLEKMRQRESLKAIPVLLMLGTPEEYDRAGLHAMGVANIIKKPLDPLEVVEKIKAHVKSGAAPDIQADIQEEKTIVASATATSHASGEFVSGDPFSETIKEGPSHPSVGGDAGEQTESINIDDLLGWPSSAGQEHAVDRSASTQKQGPPESATLRSDTPYEAPEKHDAAQDTVHDAAEVAPGEHRGDAVWSPTDFSEGYPEGYGDQPPALVGEEAGRQGAEGLEKSVERDSRQLIEEIAWEVVPSLAEALLKERVEEAATRMVNQVVQKIGQEIVEKVAWEVIPPLAETVVKKEVERMARQWTEEGTGQVQQKRIEQAVWEALSSVMETARQNRIRASGSSTD